MKICLIQSDAEEATRALSEDRLAPAWARALASIGMDVTLVVARGSVEPMLDGVQRVALRPAHLLEAVASPDRPDLIHYVGPPPGGLPAHSPDLAAGDPPRSGTPVRVLSVLRVPDAGSEGSLAAADGVIVGSRSLRDAVHARVRLRRAAVAVPPPVPPPGGVSKSETPTVGLMGPLDSPEWSRVAELARRYPNVRFLVGSGPGDRRAAPLPDNLGVVQGVHDDDPTPFDRVLSEAWVLLHPRPVPGLPYLFPLALAHGTALLSPSDPDEFVSNFGARIVDGDVDAPLVWLLRDRRWRQRGELGRSFVARQHDPSACARRLELTYRRVLAGTDPVPQMIG